MASEGGGQTTVEKSERVIRKGIVVMIDTIDHGCRLAFPTTLRVCFWQSQQMRMGSGRPYQSTFVSATVVRAISCAFAFTSPAWRGTVGPSWASEPILYHGVSLADTHVELVLTGYASLLRNLSALRRLRGRIVRAGGSRLGRLLRHGATCSPQESWYLALAACAVSSRRERRRHEMEAVYNGVEQ